MAPTFTSRIAIRALHELHNRFTENSITNALAVAVGLLTGMGSFVFRRLVDLMTHISFVDIPHAIGPNGRWICIGIPAVGGLLVAPIVHYFAREAKGHGVPEVMEAVATRGGRMRSRVALAKTVGSSLTIGSGGSAGAEGPIVQIGSTIGSTIGQIFRMSDRRIINLLACGAASGISSIFNAPIAGVFFSLEVILGDFSVQYVAPILISSVVASVFTHYMVGDATIFHVPAYTIVSYKEMFLYMILGVLAALAAILFIKILYALEDYFAKVKLSPLLKPAVGGIFVGVIGFFYPMALGTGSKGIHTAMNTNMLPAVLLILFAAKLLTTSFTLGSGGSGGIFAPSLFMGAMLGGAFGVGVNALWPGLTAPAGAYALVGMAAVFAGAAFAPITAILILFEMTGDYDIILPLMLACTVSVLIVRRLFGESIYSLKLVRRGINYKGGYNVDVLETVRVCDVMIHDVHFVSNHDTVEHVRKIMEATTHHGFPVLDDEEHLCGIICASDVRQAISEGRNKELVGRAATSHVITALPDETIGHVLTRFGSRDLGHLPVVDPEDPKKVIGIITRSDVLEAYQHNLIMDSTQE